MLMKFCHLGGLGLHVCDFEGFWWQVIFDAVFDRVWNAKTIRKNWSKERSGMGFGRHGVGK